MLLRMPMCTPKWSNHGAQYAMVGRVVVNAQPFELNSIGFANSMENIIISQDIVKHLNVCK